jgi:hypothetical protein
MPKENPMNTCLQLWLPYFYSSPFDDIFLRDIERARREWTCEDRIWLLPDIDKPKKWRLKKGNTIINDLAVPSEKFNTILVVNVDEAGNFFRRPQYLIPRRWKTLKGDLYEKFVNSKVTIKRGYCDFKCDVPYFSDETGELLGFKDKHFNSGPGRMLPINETEDGGIDVKSSEVNGPLLSFLHEGEKTTWDHEREDDCIVISKETGERGINGFLSWGQPFNEMFPCGGGPEVLLEYIEMK